ncbi:putative WRKY transcription factor 41 [Zea mays]|uniref:Putative WRKY transcription factor 41 n=1 Tax=Zea mays TaxID=4577 RepID=A0A3L6FNX7_MAIZE|nr:putative WRKY transcription factor 41 [Zea mays]
MEGVPDEKCALVAELVQVLEMARHLETRMAVLQQQGGGAGGEHQQCRALVSTMRASIDRAVHLAVSCRAEAARPESPPSGGDGSPRSGSGGSDQAGEFRGRGNATGQCKKRKALPKSSIQVRVSTVQDVSPLDDGLSWRKYGQKDILGAKYPRAYFRCTHRHTQSCQASKQVQRTDGDPLLFDVVYHGTHTCAQAATAAHHGNNQPATDQATSPGCVVAGPAALPFSLRPAASNKPTGAAADDGATSSRFIATGCTVVTASPFVYPATPEPDCQLVSGGGGYAVGGGGGVAGVPNVPDVELASTTNSPMAMGEMDFMFPLDAADFLELENPDSYF